ncbi:hypothetical protein F4821DRAFT_64475 [Hypoxylon rubiginosum]|uniref:Uncharacterized protein n=1 Tax=Hypoxylon rubiginosum TaxID=110542 RepID=A0ACC0CIP3_9PEZI|nr:hypothetical protein F4821DRAFT_64475 [Hypoxylon rubiginosum]
MLERRSLENLISISRHPVLAPAVRTLQVCIDHLVDPELLSGPEGNRDGVDEVLDEMLQSGGHDTQDMDIGRSDVPYVDIEAPCVNIEAYAALYEEQKHMFESDRDKEYLTLAMTGLANCKKIILGDRPRPWGAAYILKQTGYYPSRSMETWRYHSVDFVKRALHVSLLSAMDSGLPLRELSIDFGTLRDDCDRITPDMLALPEFDALRMRSPFTSLVHLKLLVNTEYYRGNWETNLVHFILLFVSLSHLEISFEYHDEHVLFPRLCEILCVPTLEVLDLDSVDCTESELAKLLLAHKNTLKQVSLSYIGFIAGGGDWVSLIHTIRDTLSLEYFKLGQCTQYSAARKCIFPDEGFRFVQHAEDWQRLIDLILATVTTPDA